MSKHSPDEKPLLIGLNPNSSTPIFRQVIDEVQGLVATGAIKPGDTLPSVRKLALELSVNPMTISKAYSALETAGIVVRRPGVGMIVAAEGTDVRALLRPEVARLVARARGLGMSRRMLSQEIDSAWTEDKK